MLVMLEGCISSGFGITQLMQDAGWGVACLRRVVLFYTIELTFITTVLQLLPGTVIVPQLQYAVATARSSDCKSVQTYRSVRAPAAI